MAATAVPVNPYIQKKNYFFVRINKIGAHCRINVSTQRAVLVYPERFVHKHVRIKTFPLENLQKENVSC